MRTLGINDLDLLEALFASFERSPFYVKDAQLRYRAANEAMARLCGLRSKSEMIGRCAADFYPLNDALRFEGIEQAVLRSGQSSSKMIDFVPGREPQWLVYSNHPVFDEAGNTVGVAGTSLRLARFDVEDRVYKRILLVSEILKNCLDAPSSVQELAAQAGVSKAQLQRDFKNVFGLPLRRFITQLRLEKARELLLTRRSIAQVAQEAGFTDHSAFSRRFHDEFGMTPTAFRRRRPAQDRGSP